MADIIPPGYAEVLIPIRHASLARSAAVTFGVDMNSQGGSPTLASKIQADFVAGWAGTIDAQCTIGPARLTVGQDGAENLVFVATATTTGSAGTERIPANCAVLVRKLTSRGGRRGRGRMYLPWATADTTVDEIGQLSGAEVTALQTRADTFLGLLDDAGAGVQGTPMVLLHSPSGPETQNPTTPGLPNLVTSLLIDPVIGSQRRRLGR